jgi:ATP-dependent Lhr-like helicase
MAIHAEARLEDVVAAPPSRAARAWTRGDAITELLRGRMTLAGPVTAADLAGSLGIDCREAEHALIALESDGVVLRGHFTPRGPGGASCLEESVHEWCDRALLARIHRYTVNRLRAEIEPVSPADFMRFLFRWQHVEPSSRLKDLDGLREVVSALDGFELPAGAWERSVLPSRIEGYEPSMLDMLCLAGEVAWGRLSAGPWSAATPPHLVPATPVALFLREHAEAWQILRPDTPNLQEALRPAARTLLDALRTRGASFLSDLVSRSARTADEVRETMGALVACGLAASDGFAGLRALLWIAQGKLPARDRRGQFAGRWTVVQAAANDREAGEAAVETLAWTLLRRYGVVFRRLLARETVAAPWRELVRVYRRLEARGEIRGGRFVSGMSGEQFALPDAVVRLREVRRTPPDGRLITISSADPLNLAGIVTTGDRVRVTGRNRIVYRDGIPLAAKEGEVVRELAWLEPSIAAEVSRALGTRRVHALH